MRLGLSLVAAVFAFEAIVFALAALRPETRGLFYLMLLGDPPVVLGCALAALGARVVFVKSSLLMATIAFGVVGMLAFGDLLAARGGSAFLTHLYAGPGVAQLMDVANLIGFLLLMALSPRAKWGYLVAFPRAAVNLFGVLGTASPQPLKRGLDAALFAVTALLLVGVLKTHRQAGSAG